jgi:hypothetical protein
MKHQFWEKDPHVHVSTFKIMHQSEKLERFELQPFHSGNRLSLSDFWGDPCISTCTTWLVCEFGVRDFSNSDDAVFQLFALERRAFTRNVISSRAIPVAIRKIQARDPRWLRQPN